MPVRLTEEWETEEGGGNSQPLMTYDLKDVVLGPPDDQLFELPQPYTHKQCQRQAGGFPYIHAFHWYLRF